MEEEASGTPVPEVGAAPGVNGEPANDEETHHTAEVKNGSILSFILVEVSW